VPVADSIEVKEMSENCRFYKEKMAEQRAAQRARPASLRPLLEELLATVARCEAMWALEDRIEKSR
jgi:hypothetical protein